MSKRMKTVIGVVATPFVVALGDLIYMGPEIDMGIRIMFAAIVTVLLWLGIIAWKRQAEKGNR